MLKIDKDSCCYAMALVKPSLLLSRHDSWGCLYNAFVFIVCEEFPYRHLRFLSASLFSSRVFIWLRSIYNHQHR